MNTQILNSSRLPKWQQVLYQIEQQFEEGRYEPDQPFPTLDELGNTYGVSDITARRVFSELKSQGRIVTQGRRGTFIAPPIEHQVVYMCLPQALLSLISGTLSQDTAFFGEFFERFHRQRLDQHFKIKMISIEFCMRNPTAVADAPLFVVMDSLLNINDKKVEVDQKRLAHIQKHGKAIVFRSLLGMVDGVDQISIDFRSGFEKMISYLAKQGHQHFGMLCGNLSNLWLKPRFEGFLNALTNEGLICNPRLVETTSGRNPQEDFDALDRILSQTPRPTVIVCANDSRAIHALDYCKANHIAVPQELSITGFDNSIESALCTPSLTTMDVGMAKITDAMFELVERQNQTSSGEYQHLVIEPQLICRASSIGHPIGFD